MQAGTHTGQITTTTGTATTGHAARPAWHLPTPPTWTLVALIIVCAVLASALLPD